VTATIRVLALLLVFLSLIRVAKASWLSDVVGINIDLAKTVGEPTPLQAVGQPVQLVPARPHTVPMATAEQKAHLQQQIDRTVATFKAEGDKYQSYAVSLILLSVLVALAASIAGFMRKPVAAGVLSLVVVASTGVAKAIPVNDRASYYQALYGQALSLQVDTSLAAELTLVEFNSRVDQLKTILLYASKLPGTGDVTAVTDELIKTTRTQAAPKP
jgi:hypothetical protein